MKAYLELSYIRGADYAKAELLAPLTTVRSLRLGGDPGDLRLPGIGPEPSFATISYVHDQFVFERAENEPVLLNDAVLQDSIHDLHDGDQVVIRDYRLTFHEGEIPEEPPTFDTQLRWKLRWTHPSSDAESSAFGEAAAPYIEEFQLSMRPLLQAERWAQVQQAAEAEIKRVIRSDEADPLEDYLKFLWWMRVHLARGAEDPRAVDIAREAADLHPDVPPLLAAAGLTMLHARNWVEAVTMFNRGLEAKRHEIVISRHDLRLGRKWAEHFAALGDDAGKFERQGQAWAPNDWNVPAIPLDTPADDLLLWRIARQAELFGEPAETRFLLRGEMELSQPDDLRTVQRVEIVNLKQNKSWRRLLVSPALPYADPSLTVEVAMIREILSKKDQSWTDGVVEVANADTNETPDEPVTLHPSVVQVLPTTLDLGERYLRIWCESGKGAQRIVRLGMSKAPQKDDVVYQQGPVRVAVASRDKEALTGSTLFFVSGDRGGFFLQRSSGMIVSTRYNVSELTTHGNAKRSIGLGTFVFVTMCLCVLLLPILFAIVVWLYEKLFR